MPRKKKTEEDNRIARESKQRNRLYSLKNELEAGRITDFNQVFSIISMTTIAPQMRMAPPTFRSRINNPMEFSIGEMMTLAELFGVNYTIIHGLACKCIEQDKKLPYKIT